MSKYRSLAVVAAAVAAALVAQVALADNGRHRGRDRHDGRYSDTDYAYVADVQPITRRIRISEPRRECYPETRYEPVRYAEPRPGAPPPAAGSMILGGLLGGVVGNQIGRGDGRRAATLAGAVIGSALGHDAAARRAYRDDQYYAAQFQSAEPPRAYTVERCEVRYEDRWEERIEGYRVSYEYQGRRYQTRLPYDPGERLRVRVDVFPDE